MPAETNVSARGKRDGPVTALLNLFSNVWLGVTLFALLFVYCSIGSALPGVRQRPEIELTEFEWFHWWPFNILIGLVCVNIIVVTLRRIPFRLVNAGVWTIHTGVLILCAGSYYYFTTKVEGDAPIFRRNVQINMPGMDQPVSMVALPGAQTSVIVGPDRWNFAVQSTNSAWPILSEEHQGETAYAVNVRVTPPTGDPFVRQLLAGYPQYTEDVIPGQGRAIKTIGRKLIKEDLSLSLALAPQTHFHIMKTWALFVRQLGEETWVERPIDGLPRYNDWISSRDQVSFDPHYPFPLRALDLPVPPASGGDVLSGTSLRVTGYLRYAQLSGKWREGTGRLNPVLQFSMVGDTSETHELVAFDRNRSRLNNGTVQFVWLDDPKQVSQLPTSTDAFLDIAVPDKDVMLTVPITAKTIAGRDGPLTKIDGTDYQYRLFALQDDLVIPGRSGQVSVAMVEIVTPTERFTRMVADQPSMTRDLAGDDPHAMAGDADDLIDQNITMRYQPATPPLIFAGHHDGLFVVLNAAAGRTFEKSIAIGETVEVLPGLSVRADAMWAHAVTEVKPFIEPPPSRRRDAGETFAMIRLELDSGTGPESRWIRFSSYALPSDQYHYGGRFSYLPERFRLADGRTIEVLFSRRRMRLPVPVAMEDFELETHVGGYSGSASTIMNYVSRLRFLDGENWTEPTAIRVNAPTEFGGFWFFQSMWDRPSPSNPGGGMNYTGLGVGNRNGVYIQLLGCCVIVAGTIFVFYVKPVLVRRRRDLSRSRINREPDEETGSVEKPSAMPVEV